MRCLVLFCVLFVCVEFGVVNCLKASQKGVCVVKHTVTKTRPKTVLVPTSKWCGAKKCTVKQTRRQKYTVVSNQLMCCKGYVYTSDTDSCAPVCSTGCANGTCADPDLCQCTPPLYLDPITRNKCLTPTCDHECVDSFCSSNNTCVCDKHFVEYNVTHCAKNCTEGFVLESSLNCVPKCQNCSGRCIAPGTCVCEHGYKYNGTCEPVCDPPCVNGRCAAPNTCVCDSGLVKKNASVCQKLEHSGCVGECRSNGTCLTQISDTVTEPITYQVRVRCKTGRGMCTELKTRNEERTVNTTIAICCKSYNWIEEEDKCEPECEHGCLKGECKAPNECVCPSPMILQTSSVPHTCAHPVCDQPCVEGTCIADNQCTCHDGFIRKDNYTCVPHCTNCTNGNCVSPNVCLCHPGYSKQDGKCTPQCESGCSNGYCSAPNTCTCNDGYELKDRICRPICKKPCRNGQCIAPNTCECNKGFEAKNGHNDICIPKCKSDCGHGECTAPDVCTCDPGYELKSDTCRPVCEKPCVQGDCIAPNTCKCYPGYEFKGPICVPKCDSDCRYGKCTEPNICTCDAGYELRNKKCEPVCKNACDNGKCVAPYKCECVKGFEMDRATEICKPKCDLCINGKCIAPNKCECNTGYSEPGKGCLPICQPPCINGFCSAPSVCSCMTGYSQNTSNPSVCYKPCGVCNHGTCLDGVCKCETDMQLINGTCMVLTPPNPEMSSGVTTTGLASVQMTWWVGGAVVLLLLVLVLVVMSRLWHTRKDIPQTPADSGSVYASVAYISPNTLYRRENQITEEEETSDTLLDKDTSVV